MARIDPRDARERLRDAQQKAREAAREAQERVREAQERAVLLAREAASEAHERGRHLAETMPPGLLVRLGSSLLGIPLLLGLVFVDITPRYPALLFTLGVATIALLGAGEYFRGLRLRGFQPTEWIAYVAIVFLQFAAWGAGRGQINGILPVLLAVLVIATLILQVLRRAAEPLANIGVTFFGVVYVGWLMSYLIFLRSLPGESPVQLPGGPLWAARGAWMILYVMAVTWSTDTGAYFVGSRLGKTLLAPRLSPKKTWEGAVGGLVAGTVMSLLGGSWVHLPWWHCLLLGPSLAALGQVGDLCESALKRDLGIKDFGGIMPGHGGILDRFDSLLFTAPIAYYYLVFVVRIDRLP